MTTKELVIKRIKVMPAPLLQKLLGFINTLLEEPVSAKNGKKSAKPSSKKASHRKSLYGIWAGHGTEITAQDIDEDRKEMWGNFPRDDF